ncbi:hypothetical protein BCR34DRAFT_612530 [Clohesyomyces aquaticus]|uniref:Uncharacterized protein n=1 Tax=Clohesyomyces aquaticus TaxID=1231657 RepID=A0A1Y1ZXJ3_9PLEO|nr:hypothetical protein BCR34DRAFT_612530 [Clohesyomyces aquaticus]
MDDIPPEILSRIISYVAAEKDPKLSKYAPISVQFQAAVEQITFRSLKLTSSNLGAFQEAYQGDRVERRGYLRSIEIRCILPKRKSGGCEVTRTSDWAEETKTWSDTVSRLFSILDELTRRYETHFRAPPSISLVFLDLARAFTLMPASTLEIVHLRVDTIELHNENIPLQQLSTPDAGNHVYDLILRRLSTFEKLRRLYFTGPLTVSSTLFSSCANSTASIIFPNLEEFALEFTPATSDGRWFFVRDEVAWKIYEDELDDFAGDEYDFDDSSGLDEFYHTDDEGTKMGFWVYGGTPVRQRIVERLETYRSLPNPETPAPFLTSAAEACKNMPKIKRFSLKLGRYSLRQYELYYSFVKRVFELWFISKGSTLEHNDITESPEIPSDSTNTHVNRVYLRFGDYMPEATVMESWRAVVGTEGKIFSLDEEFCERERDEWKYTGEAPQEKVARERMGNASAAIGDAGIAASTANLFAAPLI